MTVLITGGAGYIGSITTRLIRSTGRGVVVLDTLENGHRKAVGDAPFVQGDIADTDLVEKICREHGVDEVIHFAAYKAVGESMENPTKYFQNNVTGSQRLFDALNLRFGRVDAPGLDTVDGLDMLIGQAAFAFELFFGQAPPADCEDELRALLLK